MNTAVRTVGTAFEERFGRKDDRLVVRSPGRVNLIGEHTDYNEGFVLPAAVDKALIFVLAPRTDKQLRCFAVDLQAEYSCHLDAIEKAAEGWPNYLLGVVEEFRKLGFPLSGCDVAFGGDIPIGAGMSSSAAVECGFASALNWMFGFGLGKLELAKLGQRAENLFVGVQCGIMDQFVNIFGADRKVLKIDCRSLEFELHPFERTDLNIVLCETEAKRSLASSEYNVRRKQCEKGVSVLQQSGAEIRSLRDVKIDMLESHRRELDPVIYQRCSYVINENDRVLEATEDLRRNDFRAFGQKMYQSHFGLRDGYQVSSPELDFLVDVAGETTGVLGARMMGAGFGGCTINLVEQSSVASFVATVQDRTRKRSGKPCNVYVTRIQSGTELLSPAR